MGACPSSWRRGCGRCGTAVSTTEAHAPFPFYGTDWLAFGHVAIAIAFVGALRDPVRNRWLFRFGMIACALVPLWALVFGGLRGIPGWWQAIDSAVASWASCRCGFATAGRDGWRPQPRRTSNSSQDE